MNSIEDQALRIASAKMGARWGRFYGDSDHLSLGVGTVYSNVRYALQNDEDGLFDTVEGLAYILTHECDVDQNNSREFNDRVLICPIIPLEFYASEFISSSSESAFINLFSQIASDLVYRVCYFPPIANHLPYGGFIYFNAIGNSSVSSFTEPEREPVAALSEDAQRAIDWKLETHLLRPKSEPLSRLN